MCRPIERQYCSSSRVKCDPWPSMMMIAGLEGESSGIEGSTQPRMYRTPRSPVTPPLALAQNLHSSSRPGSAGFSLRHWGRTSRATSQSCSPAWMMSFAKIKKPGRSIPSAVLPPIPVPSPPPLFTTVVPSSPLERRLRLFLPLCASMVSLVSLVSSMLMMRPGLIILTTSA